MALDATGGASPYPGPHATSRITTTGSTWDLVQVPDWCRQVEVINRTGAELSVANPPYEDAATYAATDDQIQIADGGSHTVAPTGGLISIRTPASATVYLDLRG